MVVAARQSRAPCRARSRRRSGRSSPLRRGCEPRSPVFENQAANACRRSERKPATGSTLRSASTERLGRPARRGRSVSVALGEERRRGALQRGQPCEQPSRRRRRPAAGRRERRGAGRRGAIELAGQRPRLAQQRPRVGERRPGAREQARQLVERRRAASRRGSPSALSVVSPVGDDPAQRCLVAGQRADHVASRRRRRRRRSRRACPSSVSVSVRSSAVACGQLAPACALTRSLACVRRDALAERAWITESRSSRRSAAEGSSAPGRRRPPRAAPREATSVRPDGQLGRR